MDNAQIEERRRKMTLEEQAGQLQRVRNAAMWLSARIPFLGYLIVQSKQRLATERDNVPTAAITPEGLIIANPAYLEQLTDPQVRGLLAHEIMHAALSFWERKGARLHQAWNIAHDFALNLILHDFSKMTPKFELHPDWLLDEEFRGMAAEEIYANIKVKKVSLPMEDCRGDLAESAEGQNAQRGDSAAERRLGKRWQRALEEARQHHESVKGKEQGTLPAELQKILDALRDPKVTWQEVLGRWVGENKGKDDFTYMRPNRRSTEDSRLAGPKKTGFPDVTILWDTSGSMGPEETTAVLAEVGAIVEDLGLSVRLIACDAAIHSDAEGLDNIDAVVAALVGGGGSDFSPAFRRLEEEGNTSVVLGFTDGYIDCGETQPPSLQGVLWVITEGGQRPVSWGEAIKLDKDGYAETI